MIRHLVVALSLLAATAAPALAETANQRTAAHVFLAKMGKGDFSGLDRIYAPRIAVHSGGKSFTLEQDNESGKALRAAAPDMKVSVERMAGDGDLVAVHWRATGTNSAASAGMPGNGKPFDVEGMTFFRFDHDRIIEEWSVTDWMTLMRQLGSQ
jgi:steroid delta-isomerase-like uncharacterized protein